MNYRNKYVFELANDDDKEELLNIIENSSFDGRISLLYTRRPDPFGSFMKEGDQVRIAVCREKEKGCITGFGVCSVNKVFFKEKVINAGYFFGLKSRKEYFKKNYYFYRGYDFLFNTLSTFNVDFFYTTILKENIYAQKLLNKQRSFMPEYSFIGNYNVYAIKPLIKIKSDINIVIKRATFNDIDLIVEFFNNEGKKLNLFPYFEKSSFVDNDHFPVIDNFYLLTDHSKLVGLFSLWDQTDYKQYIIKGYSSFLKTARNFNYIFPLFGYPKLPVVGTSLKYITVSFWLIKDNNSEYFKEMLNWISRHCRDYYYFQIGLIEDNHLVNVFKKIPHILYQSILYQVKKNKAEFDPDQSPVKKPYYLELGRL